MKIITLTYLLFFTIFLNAQNDTLWLDEFEISSSRIPQLYSETSRVIDVITKQEIQNIPVTSVSEILEYVLNVDIRQRGRHGVQSDIGIRGGSFDQTLLLLNGIKMNDPQTGHHNLNIPVDLQDIERIEILEGPGARIYGTNAFSGAVNIVTTNQDKNQIKAGMAAGEYGYYQLSAKATYTHKNFNNRLSVSKKASEGHIENTDFDIINLFYQNSISTNHGILEMVVSHNRKSFGANSFYTAKYPNQFEKVKTTCANAKYSFGKEIRFVTSAFWRRGKDHFELFRSNHNAEYWYKSHNNHLTDVYGANINSQIKTKVGSFAVGTEIRNEHILSNILGKDMGEPIPVKGENNEFYIKSDIRSNAEFFAEYKLSLNKFSVSTGSLINWNSDYDWIILPGIDMSYNISRKIRLFGSVNKTLRLPTFTDLYYVGPTNIGNENLTPEIAINYEAGIKYFNKNIKAHISLFRRDGKNIIDWVKQNDTVSKWTPMNITELTTYGIEYSFNYFTASEKNKNPFVRNIGFNYAYLTTHKYSGHYISNYALDFLRHKMVLRLEHRLFNKLFMSWAFTGQHRNGTYTGTDQLEVAYDPVFLTDSRLYWKNKAWYVYVEASNLFNTSYFDYTSVQMPGRWVMAGIEYKLNF